MITGRSVMVVEDDPLLRIDAVMLFEEAGLDVVEMESADEALAFLLERAQDLAAIFTDVKFPGEADGFDLAGTAAAHWPHIAVLVTSGRASRPADLPASVRFVRKPWRPLDVLTAMQDAVTVH